MHSIVNTDLSSLFVILSQMNSGNNHFIIFLNLHYYGITSYSNTLYYTLKYVEKYHACTIDLDLLYYEPHCRHRMFAL